MEIIKATVEDFDLIYSEMEKNFVREEIRDRKAARAVMEDEKYVIYTDAVTGEEIAILNIKNL